MTADIFPETLLVRCEHDRVFTTSLKIAEHFHKRHADVLRAVESLLKDLLSEPKTGPSEEVTQRNFALSEGSSQRNFAPAGDLMEECRRLNFEPATYLDPTGRSLPMYRLSHDGFALLAMGFTGKEALAWKIRFLAAFRALEAELRAVRERDAAWYRNHAATLRAGWYARYPLWLDLRTAATLGETRAQMARDLGRHPSTISRNLRRLRQVGLLTTPETPRRRAAGSSPRTAP